MGCFQVCDALSILFKLEKPPVKHIETSKAKAMHSATPILPSYNYYGNPTHKASECNIPSKDLFCDYCGKEGHHEVVRFAKFLKYKQLQLPL
jgi:hypothetical protein